ncbi:hypothetical protein [Niveispirillum sp.]|uniref:hypothetical protein n=1 Tax=Niveispirillum sp. TaxID=1917217 RepID=UPI001B52B34F|nr:hypothetical protein [Niveispirillum sp.]MBP7335164.1 hypothetical protein [Niveispirillum sp.]
MLIDNSGSMKGFNGNKTIWPNLLSALDRTAGQKWAFDGTLRAVNGSLQSVPLNGLKTDLGNALRTWLSQSAPGQGAIIITDNVADDRAQSSMDSQKEWERLLQSDNIAHLVLTPLRLPFDGLIYSPVSPSLPARPYVGQRALAIYLLVRSGTGRDESRALITAMQRDLKQILSQFQQADLRFETLPITPLDISGDADQVTLTVTHQEGATVELIGNTLNIGNFSVGEQIAFGFEAVIRPGHGFIMKDARIEAILSIDGHESMVSEGIISAHVTPEQDDLVPEGRRFRIEFAVHPFEFGDLPFMTKLRLSLANQTKAAGSLRIQYSVQREKVELTDDLRRNWSFDGDISQLYKPDVGVQGLLFRLTQIVRGAVATDALTQDALVIPVNLTVRYPWQPLLQIALPILLLLGLLLWLFRMAARPRIYIGRNDANDETQLAPALTTAAYMTSGDRQCEVTIRWLVIGLWVGSGGRIRRGRLLSLGGGQIDVEVTRSGDDEPEIYNFSVEQRRNQTIADQEEDY